ncbi:hypothetical protein A0H81_01896 [Grifola frondosa]|uniref:Uncharacterized protein n=1 Tax=Grifola frondosa TaxID=5627 RepID=A0A1C7MKY5_GRIFR|nr:hypothetical protein A0H81_01896 [Grifola frondosa]
MQFRLDRDIDCASPILAFDSIARHIALFRCGLSTQHSIVINSRSRVYRTVYTTAMSSFFDKFKRKKSRKDSSSSPPKQGGSDPEPTFSIQPHPAKTNDPRDLEPPQPGGGLNSIPEIQAHHARDPYIPSADVMKNIEPPKSREELRARAAELNK